jgi:hypothetical protein
MQVCNSCKQVGSGDYDHICKLCGSNLCPDCMQQGHCGKIPAIDLHLLPKGFTCSDCVNYGHRCIASVLIKRSIRCSGWIDGSHFRRVIPLNHRANLLEID